jgi:hypothetical protein
MDTLRWTNDIDAITADFVNSFGHFDHASLNKKENPDTWSVAQNIDHLIVINRTYYPIIESAKAGTYTMPWHAKIGMITNFFGRILLKSVQPDRRKKMKTLPIWEPSQSEIPSGILHRFREEQDRLKQIIQSSSALLDQGTIICSPANRVIVYKLESAFDIIVAHEKRHFAQAKETAQRLGLQNS